MLEGRPEPRPRDATPSDARRQSEGCAAMSCPIDADLSAFSCRDRLARVQNLSPSSARAQEAESTQGIRTVAKPEAEPGP